MPRRSARWLQRTAADRAGPRAAPDRRWPPVRPHTWGCGHSDTARRRPVARARRSVPVSRGLPPRNVRTPEPARSILRRAVSPRAHVWVPSTAARDRAAANPSTTTGSGPQRCPEPPGRTPRCRLRLLLCAWSHLAFRFINYRIMLLGLCEYSRRYPLSEVRGIVAKASAKQPDVRLLFFVQPQ